eukprot:TRINITY_DN17237_c0_g1_i1.p1 TRINITY_DN17237_c0_g1~~TRINITY_DN17237_c0_g1_i1.p1  ORF type:complete len:371 (-),score=72.44 TRINITY_DN17237_c0_g1_i1:80-1063(-)
MNSNRPWWSGNTNPIWSDTSGLWWKCGNSIETWSKYIELWGDHEYQWVFEELYKNGGDFLNTAYDDEGWWAVGWLRVYQLTQEEKYLQKSISLWKDITTGWGGSCGGGIWWEKVRNYKNSIPNELFLTLSTLLYDVTKDPIYLQWARNEYKWFNGTGLINSQSLINDGLTDDCKNNGQTTWTYNQGVILGGLSQMSRIENDRTFVDQAQRIANATISILRWPNGILKETCDPNSCDQDGVYFKGIFVRYLAELYPSADADHQTIFREFMTKNVDSIWNNDRGNGFNFGNNWNGPFTWNNNPAFNFPSTMSGLDALNSLAIMLQCNNK